MFKYESILKSIWLENNEAKVYLEAIKLWPTQASIIWKTLNIPRTTARYACEELFSKNLMSKSKKWNTIIFTAEKPNLLKNQIQIQKNKLEKNEHNLDKIMWELLWFYNPYAKLPKVTFYEWEDWIKKLLEDSLTSKETIDSFVDTKNISMYFKDINDDYIKRRIKNKVRKRTIYNIEESDNMLLPENDFTEKKFSKSDNFKIQNLSFMIYDNKIVYITLNKDSINTFWVIIENEMIYNFHKSMFNLLWNTI